ncbi:hypothetical protein [Brevibacillus sp. FIR094]|uniref:hypothetical protein n=1 Tax=Brevibacillus sp. FIR094 TaxID=3134809 RepID=UPI003D2119BC
MCVNALFKTTVLTFGSQAAFASDGWGDTREQAIYLGLGASYSDTIQDYNDVDWYYHQNNSGSQKSAAVILQSPPNENYNLLVIQRDAQGFEYTTDLASAGNGGQEWMIFGINPGTKVWFKVYGNTTSDNDRFSNYKIELREH